MRMKPPSRNPKLPENIDVLPWSRKKPILEKYYRDKKYNRLLEVYVFCMIHQEIVSRKEGREATAWIKEEINKYFISHGYCNPCGKREFEKVCGDLEKRESYGSVGFE